MKIFEVMEQSRRMFHFPTVPIVEFVWNLILHKFKFEDFFLIEKALILCLNEKTWKKPQKNFIRNFFKTIFFSFF
jgi:hypothetical protein